MNGRKPNNVERISAVTWLLKNHILTPAEAGNPHEVYKAIQWFKRNVTQSLESPCRGKYVVIEADADAAYARYMKRRESLKPGRIDRARKLAAQNKAISVEDARRVRLKKENPSEHENLRVILNRGEWLASEEGQRKTLIELAKLLAVKDLLNADTSFEDGCKLLNVDGLITEDQWASIKEAGLSAKPVSVEPRKRKPRTTRKKAEPES